jgi:chromosome segregation ATPase
MPEIKSKILITSRKYLNPSIKSSPKTSKLPWSPSQTWTFIMCQSSQPVLEQKKARAEQVVKGSQAQIESNKEMLAKLQSALELKIARKAALETEPRNLSAEIEADERRIAELPGLTEKIQKEASTAMIEVNQLEAKLSALSNTQNDYQERLENINQITSNASSVIAKYLNI